MLLISAEPTWGLSATSRRRLLHIGMHGALPKDWWSLPRVAAKKYRLLPFTSGRRTFIEGFFSLRTLPAYNFVLLDVSRRCGLFIYSFVESCSFGKIWNTKPRRVYNNNIFQSRPEVRRCGGMRQKHCILYYSGALMLHNIIVLGAARGRALWFLIKTCTVLFHTLHPFQARIGKTYTVPICVCILWRMYNSRRAITIVCSPCNSLQDVLYNISFCSFRIDE